MVQLFQNLISNAIKFHREGIPPVVHVGVEQGTDPLVITVTDNGIGMDMRYADQVFAPFKRLETSGPFAGSGIGLAVAKKVVAAHEGRISIISEPGNGSTFRIELPIQNNDHETH